MGITQIDPIKYDLLFERFLNPDRISLPDIDVDFDDDGRGRVLQWVTDKYGAENCRPHYKLTVRWQLNLPLKM